MYQYITTTRPIQAGKISRGQRGGPAQAQDRALWRDLLTAALTGKLAKVKYYKDPVFGFEVPKTCPDVPKSVLEPWSSWPTRGEYDKRYKDLALRFKQNFKKCEEGTPIEVVEAGPKV